MISKNHSNDITDIVTVEKAVDEFCDLIRYIAAHEGRSTVCVCTKHGDHRDRSLSPEIQFMKLAVYNLIVERHLNELHSRPTPT
ncbi:MAG: hypothetical protein EPN30_04495 [Actinomycetota bacterium]|nr:MAG: hypothetical protein EPN30_04495 [Actinomycetota bacterium]